MNIDDQIEILKRFGLLILTDEDLLRRNARPIHAETFAQWKKRAFGKAAAKVSVMVAETPVGRTRISALAARSEGARVLKIIESERRKGEALARDKSFREGFTAGRLELQQELKAETSRMKGRRSSLQVSLLQEALDVMGSSLLPSVEERLRGIVGRSGERVDTRKLLEELIALYNAAAKSARRKIRAKSVL